MEKFENTRRSGKEESAVGMASSSSVASAHAAAAAAAVSASKYSNQYLSSSPMNSETLDKLLLAEKNLFHAGQATREAWKLIGRDVENEQPNSGLSLSSPAPPGTHSMAHRATVGSVQSLPKQANATISDIDTTRYSSSHGPHGQHSGMVDRNITIEAATPSTTTTTTTTSPEKSDQRTQRSKSHASASSSSRFSSSSSVSSASATSKQQQQLQPPPPATNRSPCSSSFTMEIPRSEPTFHRDNKTSHVANGIATTASSSSSAAAVTSTSHSIATGATSTRANASAGSGSQIAGGHTTTSAASHSSRYSYSQPSKCRPPSSPVVTHQATPRSDHHHSHSHSHSHSSSCNNNNNNNSDNHHHHHNAPDGEERVFSLGGGTTVASTRPLCGYNRESRSGSKCHLTVHTFTVKKSDGMLELLGSKRSSIQIQVDTESRILTFLSPHDVRESFSCAAVTAKPQSKLGMHLKIQTGNASLTKKLNFFSSEDRIKFMEALEQGKVMLTRKTSGLNSLVDARHSWIGNGPCSGGGSLEDSALGGATKSSNRRLQETGLNDQLALLPGEVLQESVQRVTHLVVMSANDRAVQGVLQITSYRITFAPYDCSWKFGSFEVPLAAIENIARDGLMLSIQSRDLRTIRLAMHDAFSYKKGFDQLPLTPDTRGLNLLTLRMKPPAQISNLFAFAYHTGKAMLRSTPLGKRKEDGWLVYSPVAEYQRLGFLQGMDTSHNNNLAGDMNNVSSREDSCISVASTRSSSSIVEPSSFHAHGRSEPITWRLLKNSKFRFSPTYPQLMIVPTMMSEEQLVQSARFRSRARLPVVVWRHPINKSVLARSSQPNYGMAANRSEADRLLLRAYRDSANRNSANMAPPLHIVDARKPIATKGNRLKGKGVENSQHYDNAIIEFMGIANIHKMRESLDALKSLISPHGVEDGDKHYHNRLENTRWLKHVMRVISGARRIAQILHEDGASVLVHCSDGWDRTPQLVALAQLILDPYYRTIRGFAVLVEKEWCSFGHKFADRVGVGKEPNDLPNERSPVMLQFLDCVWQMTRQFPTCFEFNEQLLLHVADSLISGLYGTFLYNSERERIFEKVWERTESVWTPVLEDSTPFKNALYRGTNRVLYPRANLKRVVLWDAMFYRWDPENNPDYMDTVALMPEGVDAPAPQEDADPLAHGCELHRDRTFENLLNESPDLSVKAALEAEEKALRLEIDGIQDFDDLRARNTLLSDCSSLSDEEDLRAVDVRDSGFRGSHQFDNNDIEESVERDDDTIQRYRRGVEERTKQRAQARTIREALQMAPDASRIKYLEQLLSESVARELQLEAELDSLHNQLQTPSTT